MSIFLVRVTGVDRGEACQLTFVMEAKNDEDALVNAANMQRVAVLDEVHNISTEKA